MSSSQATFSKTYSFEKECAPEDHGAKRRICGMIVTHDCNLSCAYCYVPKKRAQVMSLETARRTIEKAFAGLDRKNFAEIEFDFLGGEPLLAFGLLQEICEWAWERDWPCPYVFFATTNGTLLTDEMKRWFAEHRAQFVLGLSYDGDAAMQDMNRPRLEGFPIGSSSTVDLDFFRETWPGQPVKMTVSPETIGSLARGCVALHERGLLVHANLAHGAEWRPADYLDYAVQLKQLASYYLEHPEVPRASVLDLDPRLLSKESAVGNKYCGAGTGMVVTDVDGVEYPCQMFSPLALPRPRIEAAREINFEDLLAFADAKCGACVMRDLCPTCYGINYRNTGHPAIREEPLCRMFIIQTLSNCRFQSDRIRRIPRDHLSENDRRIAAAVVRILDLWRHKSVAIG